MNLKEIQSAYADYNRRDSIANAKVGSILAIILMPAGSFTMDYFMYRHEHLLWPFFQLRLGSAIFTAGVLGLLMSRWAEKYYRVLRVAWYWIPMIFIACLIAGAGDPKAPYYAGFNLVLIAVGVVLPWTYKEILATALLISGIYIAIALDFGWRNQYLANNLFFLGCTATIVTTGSFFYSRIRFREFALRYELDASQQMLKETNEKLVELGQVKDRFFANISHDLRTPLTLLLSPLETMLNQRGVFDEDTRSLFAIMHSNGMRLLKLINDLLDLVRLESGRMEVKREPMQMAAFIAGIGRAAQQMAENKGIKWQTSVEPDFGAVLLDRDKLEKITLNLVFNALKFTPRDGSVKLHVARDNSDFTLTVVDTGIGIAQKSLPFVFDRFWQADGSSKRKFQGVGIGLSLVKELTEVHGGKVSVQSEEGKGTTFTIRLPYVPVAAAGDLPPLEQLSLAAEKSVSPQSEEWLANLYRRAEFFPAAGAGATAPADSAKPSRNGHQPTLLVADDEPDMLRFLTSQLRNKFQVTETVDGKQAVEKALELLPDMILVDMNMPEKDGLQVCRELRETPSTRNIPIIMLTARADEQTKLTALSAGANDFLAKPFSTTELHVRIKNLLAAHEYQVKLADKNKLLEETIEQLKQTEIQLVQSEKLASMGRMSAGIIHEINNPLNYATTGLYSLRNKGKFLPADQQTKFAEVLADVEDGINRVKNIVLDLRKFSHPDHDTMDEVEILPVVNSALRLLSGELKDEVRVALDVPAALTIRANPNRLAQVFINLLQNALDASRQKKFSNGERATIWISARTEPGKVIVSIRDNGMGIEEENLGKIFDPFFTTKDVGEGMGLGLSICYKIMEGFGGKIGATSAAGKFAEFSLEFPTKHPSVAL